jgi:NAD(P)-dependent dehydrogenase (short-subunit alcohol dehydrogenase family)
MSTVVVTGSAGGIGRATCARLVADGHRVIGVDVRDAQIVADLSCAEGRDAMVAAVERACGGMLDGVVAGAGVMGDDPQVVSINFFGAVATLRGLRPMLARAEHPRAIAISSNSTTAQPGLAREFVDTILTEDEDAARDATAKHPGCAYAGSKLALARWVRRAAVTDEWVGAGIALNAIAPGLVETPMTADSMDFIMGLGDVFPIPAKRPGRPEEVAGLLAYLLSPDAGFFCGSVVFMDGGSDATLRADDWPAPLGQPFDGGTYA